MPTATQAATTRDNLAKALVACQSDSAKFVRSFLGIEPDAWQLDALKAVDEGKHVAIRSGHGPGKTALLAWITIQTVACWPDCKVPCTAPTQHQLSDLLWAEISLWLAKSPLKGWLEWTATKLAPRGEESWFAVARSCSDPNNLAGFHAPKFRYIVDEAASVPDATMAVVDGALTTEGAQVIMAGNPTTLSGAFYDAFHRSRALYHSIHISSLDSPRVEAAWCERMAAKWGADSDIYRVRVLGEFPRAESDSFIGLDLVEAAINRYNADPNACAQGVMELGIDVARYGDDETCFAVRHGGRLVHLEPVRGWPVTQTAGHGVQLARQLGCTAAKIDDTGVGGGVTDIMREAGLENCAIVPMNFGGEGDDDYHNAVSRWYGGLKDMLRAGEIALPDDEDLVAQLSTRKFRLTSKGRIELERKDDMKKRGLPSPDRAEAVALAFANIYTRPSIVDLDDLKRAEVRAKLPDEIDPDDDIYWT